MEGVVCDGALLVLVFWGVNETDIVVASLGPRRFGLYELYGLKAWESRLLIRYFMAFLD